MSQQRRLGKSAALPDSSAHIGHALYPTYRLGQVTCPFSIKDSDNVLLGQVRSSVVFLQENGVAGTVQQIDLR